MRSFILIVSVVIGLSGCGVKPSEVDPPGNPESDPYPRTYPRIYTE